MSDRTRLYFRFWPNPVLGAYAAVALLHRLIRRLQYTVSDHLDAKPEELVEAALKHARAHGRRPICIAASFPLTEPQLEEISRIADVNGVISKQHPSDLQLSRQRIPDANLGALWEPGRWIMPVGPVHVYFIGSWRLITVAMLREAFRHQVVTLSARCAREWIDLPLGIIRHIAAARRLLSTILRSISPYKRWLASYLGSLSLIARHRRRWAPYLGWLSPVLLCRARIWPDVADADRRKLVPKPRVFDAALLTETIIRARQERIGDFVPGRVVLVCGNLQPGGAERQVVYTALGIARSQAIESVSVLCDMLAPGHPARYDFYLPLLERSSVQARVIERSAINRSMVEAPNALVMTRDSFPEGLLVDVANLYGEFVRLRPEVVHAWLDWSNTRAGLAAALAGVPRILLSGRNLNPTHFALYQPYMDPVYAALRGLPNVTFLNNSDAGAKSYSMWLGISPDQVRVIHNGFHMQTVNLNQARMIRAQLGIPQNASLIGGIFRFSAEKRPLLWIDVAARVAKIHPNAWFVVFGQGDLRADMQKRARASGIADRLIMPGVVDDVLPAIRAFDVFLLTSFGEGIPNVVLEAQWAGTPVVATDAGGVAEALELGVSGWIVDPADPALLADRVCWILHHPEIISRARTAGPEFIGRKFAMQPMIDQTLQAYGLA